MDNDSLLVDAKVISCQTIRYVLACFRLVMITRLIAPEVPEKSLFYCMNNWVAENSFTATFYIIILKLYRNKDDFSIALVEFLINQK